MYKISILMYHQIGEFSRPRDHRATFCHVRRFRAQMAYLHHLNYRVLSLPEALTTLYQDNRSYGHSVVLTFDDGYQSFEDYAFPVLQRYNFPACVFVVAGLIGKSARWLEEDGRYAPAMLGRQSIRRLASANISFGSHTLNHPLLTRIDRNRRIEEVTASKTILEDILEDTVDFFCYPSGDFDTEIVDAVRNAGYTAALTCIRGSATSNDDPLVLPRKAISFGDSLLGYFWKLHLKHHKKAI